MGKHKLALKHTVLKIVQISIIVSPSRKVFLVKDDPDYNAILECALEGEVD